MVIDSGLGIAEQRIDVIVCRCAFPASNDGWIDRRANEIIRPLIGEDFSPGQNNPSE